MKKDQTGFASAEQTESVFYEAFVHGDIDVMAAIWSKQQSQCIHPGSGLIDHYQSVIRSWSHILSQGGRMNIKYRVLQKTESSDLAVHLVEELLDSGEETVVVMSTNVYRKTEHGWQIVLHHGSVVQSPVPAQKLN